MDRKCWDRTARAGWRQCKQFSPQIPLQAYVSHRVYAFRCLVQWTLSIVLRVFGRRASTPWCFRPLIRLAGMDGGGSMLCSSGFGVPCQAVVHLAESGLRDRMRHFFQSVGLSSRSGGVACRLCSNDYANHAVEIENRSQNASCAHRDRCVCSASIRASHFLLRRGARVADRGGLENRCPCKRTVGSNPTLSAIFNCLVNQ